MTEREELLQRIAAAGVDAASYADAPIEELRWTAQQYERATRLIAEKGRLGALWSQGFGPDGGFGPGGKRGK
ncbi:hypothetical protein K9U40_10245 [Xanthobacter autotrophicus]|uniref:hypothetical protein n=1 Tax=Xanthobacter TaxID=279 RepID=UPI0024AA0CD9|nr:hypothetical protein [Xanthobacter autotrophicus]MDI4664705.1 hypothetical protein [Xanthobacter autotrophicus]